MIQDFRSQTYYFPNGVFGSKLKMTRTTEESIKQKGRGSDSPPLVLRSRSQIQYSRFKIWHSET